MKPTLGILEFYNFMYYQFYFELVLNSGLRGGYSRGHLLNSVNFGFPPTTPYVRVTARRFNKNGGATLVALPLQYA